MKRRGFFAAAIGGLLAMMLPKAQWHQGQISDVAVSSEPMEGDNIMCWVKPGEWVFVMRSYENDTVKTYINGKLFRVEPI